MKFSKPFLAAMAALPFFVPTEAEAGKRCKTYSKVVYVDGHPEMGYGKACRIEKDLWEIVRVSGDFPARNAVKRRMVKDLHHRGYDIVNHRSYRHGYDYGYHRAYHHYDNGKKRRGYRKGDYHKKHGKYKSCNRHHH